MVQASSRSASSFDGRFWPLAFCLSALAGYVDAIGFLSLGGLFVSFMSGNSTQMAVGLAHYSPVALGAAFIILIFVLGVIVGALVAARAGQWRKPVVLIFVAAVLTIASLCGSMRLDHFATSGMVLAMGAANAVFQRNGEVSVGVTYMTGTLVKMGQHLANSLRGGPIWAWVPHFLLWAALVFGALAGATLFPMLQLNALWIAAMAAIGLAIFAASLGPAQA